MVEVEISGNDDDQQAGCRCCVIELVEYRATGKNVAIWKETCKNKPQTAA